MDAAGEAMGATTPWLSTRDAVGRGDVQPSLVTTIPWPPLPSPVLSLPTPAAVSLGGFSPPLPTQPLPLQVPIPLPVSCLIYPSD